MSKKESAKKKKTGKKAPAKKAAAKKTVETVVEDKSLVYIDYVGRTKEDGKVFDLTMEEDAKRRVSTKRIHSTPQC